MTINDSEANDERDMNRALLNNNNKTLNSKLSTLNSHLFLLQLKHYPFVIRIYRVFAKSGEDCSAYY